VAAHAQNPSDVHVLQSRQDPNIAVEIQPEQAQTQVMVCQIVTQSLNTSLTASHTFADRSVYSDSDLYDAV
jgi:nitrogen regulatory protein PII-like uncharacterized protein